MSSTLQGPALPLPGPSKTLAVWTSKGTWNVPLPPRKRPSHLGVLYLPWSQLKAPPTCLLQPRTPTPTAPDYAANFTHPAGFPQTPTMSWAQHQGPGVSHSGAALGPRKHPVHKDTGVHPRAVQGMQSDSEDRVRPRTALGKDVADWEDQEKLPRGGDAGTET